MIETKTVENSEYDPIPIPVLSFYLQGLITVRLENENLKNGYKFVILLEKFDPLTTSIV